MVINLKTSLHTGGRTAASVLLFFTTLLPAPARQIEIVVHRGANALAPENTVASAYAALEHGATWVEVDVRASRDGVLYNLHDETLDRTTNGHGRLSDMPSSEADLLDAGSWFSKQFAGTRFPRISEMLDSLKGKANVFFDVKRGTPIPSLIRLVREKGFSANSFFWFGDEQMLREFIRLAPEMKIKVNAGDVERLKYWQRICRPSYVEIAPEKITRAFRNYCHRHGIRVMAACQEDDISQFQTVIDREADLVNLDRPEIFFYMIRKGNGPFVDPRIGSEGVGRTFPGPSMPFGMVKPGPDCTVIPNAGWAPMPEVVTGFSQTHVSGTGGGQKYGNVLLQPFVRGGEREKRGESYAQRRVSEDISLGYYATTFENGIKTEITTSERCAFYRIGYPHSPSLWRGAGGGLYLDASHFLGKDSVADLRERQQFVGAEVEIVNDREVRGYSRVRGGWNNGDAYTVYFCLTTDKPFESTTDKRNEKAILHFNDTLVNVKVGVSFVSTMQAKRNIPNCDFDTQLVLLRNAWEKILSRIHIEGTEAQKRMFYTGIYHTCLMPVDRTGENPLWTETPYYDDYYAIWDTYRTSTPLITLLDERREADIVNSLLNIYKREGYMPDARSGNCNGRTQGGSNAEVVIADAYAKGLQGIDYELALEAMLKDADADPGADHEKHGRGGVLEYNALGYIPYGIDRAGTRTVEYAYDDWCIAQVAKGLGRPDLYERFTRQSGNWRNLWRKDYEWDGIKGYIMPKDAQGQWLDSVPWGRSKVFHPTIPFTPITKAAPWYLPWWSTFFYEALSAEYSLSIPHDVPGLIEACGGKEAFRQRLDMFFERKRYNVGNEPSFLTPCLYHWLGRPDLTSDRVRQIITDNYNDSSTGLPGNDDSGAMSSWLVFHMMGLYPNAGQDYYLLHTPLLKGFTMRLCNGKTIHGTLKGKGTHFRKVTFNGKELKDARISHQQLMEGGELVFWKTENGKRKMESPKSAQDFAERSNHHAAFHTPHSIFNISYTLNKQLRTWPVSYTWQGDTLLLTCKETIYKTARSTVESARKFSWENPQIDGTVYHDVKGTFAFISKAALKDLLEKGQFVYDGILWRQIDRDTKTIHVRADTDLTEMWISTETELPFIIRMKGNPLGIDWTLTPVPTHD